MAVRDEKFIYNGVTVGGSTGASSAQILDRFGFAEGRGVDSEECEFVAQFVVTGNSYSDLATKCNTLEEALRTPYATLEVFFAAATQWAFDPNPAGITSPLGFCAMPSLRKLSAIDTGLARCYEFRVTIQLPPNYTDTSGPALGRRNSDVNLHYDVTQRRVVTISGTWTELDVAPGKYSREQFASQINAFATSRLGFINTLIAQVPTPTWVLTNADARENNDRSLTSFIYEYSEHVNGRRGSTTEVVFAASRLRMVTIRGTYLRTVVPASAASVNYANFENAFDVATLGALTAAQGGPLVPGDDCELVAEDAVPNEQDDRLDFTRIYREIQVGQSSAIQQTFLDDPQIFLDSMTFVVEQGSLDDSPAPGPVNTSPAGAVGAVGGGVGGMGPGPTGGAQGGGPVPPGPQGGAGVTVEVKKPNMLMVFYEAQIIKSVVDLRAKWEKDLRKFLITKFQIVLGFTGMEMISHHFEVEQQTNTIKAVITARVYPGPLFSFKYSQTINDDLGIRLDKAFTGTAHDYLVQQALPGRTMTRTITAGYTAGAAFDISKFETPQIFDGPGWVVVQRSRPDKVTRVVGIQDLGIPTQSLTSETLVEFLVYVNSNVKGPGKTATGGGGGNTPETPSSDPTGQGANFPGSTIPQIPGTATGGGISSIMAAGAP